MVWSCWNSWLQSSYATHDTRSHRIDKYASRVVIYPPWIISSECWITPLLHRPAQGSLANYDSGKDPIFPNSGILTSFQGGVTQNPLENYLRGARIPWQTSLKESVAGAQEAKIGSTLWCPGSAQALIRYLCSPSAQVKQQLLTSGG